MKAGTQNHLKTKRLKRLLGIPLYRAVGILETLWLLCTDCCDDGNVGKFSDQEISDYIEWDGDPTAMVNALVDAGWLDQVAGRPVVHDWLEHCPDFISDRIRKRIARAAKSAKRHGPDHDQTTYASHEQDSNGQTRTITGQSESVPSIPNQTQPNQFKPNQPTPLPPFAELDEPDPATPSTAGGRAGGDYLHGWGLVADRLAELKASRWREAIADAKQCGCTPGHAMELLAYAKSKGYQVGAVIVRLSKARPTLPLEEGWPPIETSQQVQKLKSDAASDRQKRQRDEADASHLIIQARRAKKTDDEIKMALAAAGLEWPK